jgi:hypothetical protein
MNLDLAILNALKRTPMQGAMNAVVSNYGQQYEIHAVHQDMKVGQSLTGTQVATASGNGVITKAVREGHKLGLDANEFSRVWTPTSETMIPVSAPLTKEGPIGHFTSLPMGNNAPALTVSNNAQWGGVN